MNLYEITKELAACNGVEIKNFDIWPDVSCFGFDVADLDNQALSIPDDKIQMFVDGDETEIYLITEEFKLDQLNRFLNMVFEDDIEILDFKVDI